MSKDRLEELEARLDHMQGALGRPLRCLSGILDRDGAAGFQHDRLEFERLNRARGLELAIERWLTHESERLANLKGRDGSGRVVPLRIDRTRRATSDLRIIGDVSDGSWHLHAFVERATGNILKAAAWMRADPHRVPQGNVYTHDFSVADELVDVETRGPLRIGDRVRVAAGAPHRPYLIPPTVVSLFQKGRREGTVVRVPPPGSKYGVRFDVWPGTTYFVPAKHLTPASLLEALALAAETPKERAARLALLNRFYRPSQRRGVDEFRPVGGT